MNIGHYIKYLVAILTVLVAGLAAAIADGSLSVEEGINLGIITLGAVATYLIPNLPEGIGQYAKLIVQALTAGLVLLVTLLVGGVTLGEWLQVGAAILGAFTVYAVPNAPKLLAVDHGGKLVYQPDGR